MTKIHINLLFGDIGQIEKHPGLAEKWTVNEDVCPIENGDFFQCHV